MRIYLAGPEVFLPNSNEIGHRKKDLCAKYGYEGLYPGHGLPYQPTAQQIFKHCIQHIYDADCGIFNLTPWRGPSADVGTVLELGMMRNRLCFGYTNDVRDYKGRAEVQYFGGLQGVVLVEDFGLSDNLMIDLSLTAPMVRHQHTHNYYTDLWGFDRCLQLVKEHYGN